LALGLPTTVYIAVLPVHDSQVFEKLLDGKNSSEDIWVSMALARAKKTMKSEKNLRRFRNTDDMKYLEC
jgi:hypothetical protein